VRSQLARFTMGGGFAHVGWQEQLVQALEDGEAVAPPSPVESSTGGAVAPPLAPEAAASGAVAPLQAAEAAAGEAVAPPAAALNLDEAAAGEAVAPPAAALNLDDPAAAPNTAAALAQIAAVRAAVQAVGQKGPGKGELAGMNNHKVQHESLPTKIVLTKDLRNFVEGHTGCIPQFRGEKIGKRGGQMKWGDRQLIISGPTAQLAHGELLTIAVLWDQCNWIERHSGQMVSGSSGVGAAPRPSASRAATAKAIAAAAAAAPNVSLRRGGAELPRDSGGAELRHEFFDDADPQDGILTAQLSRRQSDRPSRHRSRSKRAHGVAVAPPPKSAWGAVAPSSKNAGGAVAPPAVVRPTSGQKRQLANDAAYPTSKAPAMRASSSAVRLPTPARRPPSSARGPVLNVVQEQVGAVPRPMATAGPPAEWMDVRVRFLAVGAAHVYGHWHVDKHRHLQDWWDAAKAGSSDPMWDKSVLAQAIREHGFDMFALVNCTQDGRIESIVPGSHGWDGDGKFAHTGLCVECIELLVNQDAFGELLAEAKAELGLALARAVAWKEANAAILTWCKRGKHRAAATLLAIAWCLYRTGFQSYGELWKLELLCRPCWGYPHKYAGECSECNNDPTNVAGGSQLHYLLEKALRIWQEINW